MCTARLQLKRLRNEASGEAFADELIEALSVIDGEFDFAGIGPLRQKLATIPLPVAICADPERKLPAWARDREGTDKEKAPDLTVTFVEFTINGTTAKRIQALRPRENHDLDIAVRVSRWPETATALVLSPSPSSRRAVTISPPSASRGRWPIRPISSSNGGAVCTSKFESAPV